MARRSKELPNVDQDPDSATQRVLGGLDADAAELVRGYLAEPLASPELLSEHARVYFKQLEGLAAEGEVIDVELATSLAMSCDRLLDEIDDDTSEEHQRLIQAAVRYFVNEEDADGDTESLIGFDDDNAVIEAVAIAVGCAHVLEGED